MNKYTYQISNENNGITVIENIFINEFMPSARGEYVKVYLYALKLTQYPSRIAPSDEELAKTLNLSVTDVRDAWAYWEKQGILVQKRLGNRTEIVFRNISESRYHDEPELTVTREIPDGYEDAIAKIEEMLGQEITPSLYQALKVWIGDYHFTPMLVTYLIEYSLNRIDPSSSLNNKVKYFDRVAMGWHEDGICDYPEASDNVEKHQRKNDIVYKVLSCLGQRGRRPMTSEYKTVGRWLDEYGFDEEMILEAASRATVSNIKYVNAILEGWHREGWQKVSDIVDKPRMKKTVKEKKRQIIDADEDLYAAYR